MAASASSSNVTVVTENRFAHEREPPGLLGLEE
jgi:hypothetical protein